MKRLERALVFVALFGACAPDGGTHGSGEWDRARLTMAVVAMVAVLVVRVVFGGGRVAGVGSAGLSAGRDFDGRMGAVAPSTLQSSST